MIPRKKKSGDIQVNDKCPDRRRLQFLWSLEKNAHFYKTLCYGEIVVYIIPCRVVHASRSVSCQFCVT